MTHPEPSQEEYNNGRPLERLFSNPAARVLDFLILNQRFDYSESDISRLAGVPPRTLQRVLPNLLRERLVKRTRKSGKAFMYVLNRDSERALALEQYFRATLKENLDDPVPISVEQSVNEPTTENK
ncbi:MAG: hypothetical protein HRF40_00420 [Nitrososphaera sp.]|jgi:AraC-like DNA-binding protein